MRTASILTASFLIAIAAFSSPVSAASNTPDVCAADAMVPCEALCNAEATLCDPVMFAAQAIADNGGWVFDAASSSADDLLNQACAQANAAASCDGLKAQFWGACASTSERLGSTGDDACEPLGSWKGWVALGCTLVGVGIIIGTGGSPGGFLLGGSIMGWCFAIISVL